MFLFVVFCLLFFFFLVFFGPTQTQSAANRYTTDIQYLNLKLKSNKLAAVPAILIILPKNARARRKFGLPSEEAEVVFRYVSLCFELESANKSDSQNFAPQADLAKKKKSCFFFRQNFRSKRKGSERGNRVFWRDCLMNAVPLLASGKRETQSRDNNLCVPHVSSKSNRR